MNGQDGNRYTKDPDDLKLARAIRNLDREIQPQRDLWPGVERRIVDYPRRKRPGWMDEWMPWGVAASLVVALSSLMISIMSDGPTVEAPGPLDAVEAEYMRVRDPLVEQFTETNKSLDPQTLEELYRNIAIMEQARREIEAQLRENPGNPRLLEMLMSVHEQELELLREDYTHASRSM